MRTFRINTTGYSEEDFFITSNLTKQEIIDVINPIVMNERNNDIDYDNEDLRLAILEKYPNREIQISYGFEKIEI